MSFRKKKSLVFKMVVTSFAITSIIMVLMSVYEMNTFIDKVSFYLENTLLRENIRVHEKVAYLSDVVDKIVSSVAKDLAKGKSVSTYDDVAKIEILKGKPSKNEKGFRVIRKVIINGEIYNLYVYINPRVMRGIVKDRSGNIRILVVDSSGKVILPEELSGKKLDILNTTTREVVPKRLENILEKYKIRIAAIGDQKYYLMEFESSFFSGYKVFIVMDYQRTLGLVRRSFVISVVLNFAVVLAVSFLVFSYVRNLTLPVQKVIDHLRERRISGEYNPISVEAKSEEIQDMVIMINELLSSVKKSLEEAQKREEALKALHEKVVHSRDRLFKIDSLIGELMAVDSRKAVLEMAMRGISSIFNEIKSICYEFEGEEIGKESGGICDDDIPLIITVSSEHGEYRFHIFAKTELSEDHIGMLDMFFNIVAAIAENKDLWGQIENSYFYLTQKLSEVSEVYDDETGKHIKRVGEYSAVVAKELGMDKGYVEKIRMFSQLHDIGKLRVPREILMKPDKLTQEEMEIMKKHTVYGAEFLGEQLWLRMARNIALYHHENWDGSGYPFGLKGEEIPLEARIVKIADVYDALRSPRRYKPMIPHDETVKIILEGDGRTMPSHFDPQILEIFKRVHLKFNEIFEINRD